MGKNRINQWPYYKKELVDRSKGLEGGESKILDFFIGGPAKGLEGKKIMRDKIMGRLIYIIFLA